MKITLKVKGLDQMPRTVTTSTVHRNTYYHQVTPVSGQFLHGQTDRRMHTQTDANNHMCFSSMASV